MPVAAFLKQTHSPDSLGVFLANSVMGGQMAKDTRPPSILALRPCNFFSQMARVLRG